MALHRLSYLIAFHQLYCPPRQSQNATYLQVVQINIDRQIYQSHSGKKYKLDE